jgi:hypothetical protein
MMECPICSAPAELIDPPTFDAVSIRCPQCGDFDVSGYTWEAGLLGSLTEELRRLALLTARRGSPSSRRPLINSYAISAETVTRPIVRR